MAGIGLDAGHLCGGGVAKHFDSHIIAGIGRATVDGDIGVICVSDGDISAVTGLVIVTDYMHIGTVVDVDIGLPTGEDIACAVNVADFVVCKFILLLKLSCA